MKFLLQQAKLASYTFGNTSFALRQSLVRGIAQVLRTNTSFILAANAKDLEKLGEDHPLFDRLLLTEERIESIAKACENIAEQANVLGKLLEKRDLENGLHLRKIAVPMGVVACIYEARPNVTVDIAALCLFTGNVCILRGSSSAQYSNTALIKLIHSVLQNHEIDPAVVSQYSTNRDDLPILFEATKEVDLLIPRGGAELIERVRRESLVPVIETGAGVCHTFVDESAKIDMAVNIVVNAKTQRPSVCNSLDSLIVHENLDKKFYIKLLQALEPFGVCIWADKASFQKFPKSPLVHPGGQDYFGKEFLSLQMCVKTVASLDEAIKHINTYGSRHSEAIVSEKQKNVDQFFQQVDASSLYHNASTRFTDGGEFGLGAEIGISTQKLHARGPMGAEALVTYKYLLEGNGEVRK